MQCNFNGHNPELLFLPPPFGFGYGSTAGSIPVDPSIEADELYQAVDASDLLAVGEILTRKPGVVHCADQQGWTALHKAVRSGTQTGGNSEIVSMLVGAGANVNAANHQGETAVHLALKAGNSSRILAELSKCGSTPNLSLQDANGDTPVHWFLRNEAWWRHEELIDQLVSAQPNMDVRNKHGDTPIHLVMRSFCRPFSRFQVKAAKEFLAMKADVKSRMTTGRDPFNHAIFEVVECLQSGNVSLCTDSRALWDEIASMLNEMVFSGADVNGAIKGTPYINIFLDVKMRPFSYSLLRDFVDTLLKRADIGRASRIGLGGTALHVAVAERGEQADRNTAASHREVIHKLLLRPRVDFNRRDNEGRTAFDLYVERWYLDPGFLETAALFVRRGASTANILQPHFASTLPGRCLSQYEQYPQRYTLHGGHLSLAASSSSAVLAPPSIILPSNDHSVPEWVLIWLSACEQDTWEAAEMHLRALRACSSPRPSGDGKRSSSCNGAGTPTPEHVVDAALDVLVAHMLERCRERLSSAVQGGGGVSNGGNSSGAHHALAVHGSHLGHGGSGTPMSRQDYELEHEYFTLLRVLKDSGRTPRQEHFDFLVDLHFMRHQQQHQQHC